MLLIFGIRGMLRTIASGTFFCPRCGTDRAYTHKAARRWFTFFFVPIFPVSQSKPVGVRCETCGGLFSEQVLSLPTTDVQRATHGRAVRQCVVAVLKSGDPHSALARACAIATIDEALDGAIIDEAALDQDLEHADPSQLAVYASPVANRGDARASEQLFASCAKVALADGPLSSAERDALRNLGESLNLSEATQVGTLALLRAPSERAAPPEPS